MQQQYSTNQTMTVGGILDYTFHVYCKNFKWILCFSALVAGIFNLIHSWVTKAAVLPGATTNIWETILRVIETGDMSIINAQTVPSEAYDTQWIMRLFIFQGLSALIGIVYAVLIMPFVQGGIAGITHQYAHGTKLDIRTAFSLPLKRFWKLAVTALCLVLYYLGVGIVLLIIAMIGMFPLMGMGFIMINGPTMGSIAGLTAMAILFVLFIIFIIIIAEVFISFTYPAVMAEDMFHFNAMGRSFTLVGKNFWKVLGVALLINLISLIVMLLLGVIVFVLMMLTKSSTLAGYIFPFLTTSIVAPIRYIAFTVLYIDVRRQIEGSNQ